MIPGGFVETDCLGLSNPCLKPYRCIAQIASPGFQGLQNLSCDAAAPEFRHHEHALDLAYAGLQAAQRPTSDCAAIDPCNDECKIRIDDILRMKAMDSFETRVAPKEIFVELPNEILSLLALGPLERDSGYPRLSHLPLLTVPLTDCPAGP